MKQFLFLENLHHPTSKHTSEHKHTQANKMTDQIDDMPEYIWTIIEGYRADLTEKGELIDYHNVNPKYYHTNGRKYYLKNRDKILEAQKKYYIENKEACDKRAMKWKCENKELYEKYHREKSKIYYAENKDRLLELARIQYLENKEYFKENAKKYYDKNREKVIKKVADAQKKPWQCPHCEYKGMYYNKYYHVHKSKCALERAEAEEPPKKVKKRKLRIIRRAEPPVEQ